MRYRATGPVAVRSPGSAPPEFLAPLGVVPIVHLPADALLPDDVSPEELDHLLGHGLIEEEDTDG